MSAKDRRLIGQETAAEATARGAARSERHLQSEMRDLLMHRGVEVLWHRTDTKSAGTIGWPDLTFVWRGVPCAWEIKMPGSNPRPGQIESHVLLVANGWDVRVLQSVEEFLAALEVVGTPPAT